MKRICPKATECEEIGLSTHCKKHDYNRYCQRKTSECPACVEVTEQPDLLTGGLPSNPYIFPEAPHECGINHEAERHLTYALAQKDMLRAGYTKSQLSRRQVGDRERIARLFAASYFERTEITDELWNNATQEQRDCWLKWADKILSLLNVKSEEEVREEERKKIGEWLREMERGNKNNALGDASARVYAHYVVVFGGQGKEVKRCTVKKCGLYPEFCPDASNNGSYTTCILTKKEKKKR